MEPKIVVILKTDSVRCIWCELYTFVHPTNAVSLTFLSIEPESLIHFFRLWWNSRTLQSFAHHCCKGNNYSKINSYAFALNAFTMLDTLKESKFIGKFKTIEIHLKGTNFDSYLLI